MKLKDNLYTLIGKERMEDDRYRFVIVLNSDSPIYAAHFPGMPITPGVCIIRLVEELVEEQVGQPLRLLAIKNAKFIAALTPDGQELCVSCSLVRKDDGVMSSQVSISDFKGNVYAKISLQTVAA